MKSLLFFLLPFTVIAQDKINANQFLELGLQSWVEESPTIDQSIYFPWIEEVQLRTESDEFEFKRQEYTLRLSPTTPGIRKAQQKLLSHIQNQGNYDIQKAYCKLRNDIHEDWLDLYLIDQHSSILEELTLNIKDRETVYNRLMNAGDIDFQKLINLKTDKSDVAFTNFNLNIERESIISNYGSDFIIDFESMLSVEQIIEEVSVFSLTSTLVNNEELDYKREMINRELALEKAERRKIFDFAQVKYRGPHDNLIEERLSVGLGLKLSRDGGGKLKMRELELKKNQLDIDEKNEQVESKSILEDIEAKIRLEYENYLFFLSLVEQEEIELNQLAEKIKTLEGFNPLLLLNMGERKISNQLKRLKFEEDIYKLYIDFLAESGKACEGDHLLLVK